MWRLTQEQQELVTDNLGLAGLAVNKVKTWLEWDDVYSVSCAALCRAAHYFNKTRNVQFTTYAVHCCIKAIIKEQNYQNKVSGYPHRRPFNFSKSEPVAQPESSFLDAIHYEDAERVTKAIADMHQTPRTILEMWLAGLKQTEIASAIGMSRSGVSASLVTSRRRLKETLDV